MGVRHERMISFYDAPPTVPAPTTNRRKRAKTAI
jgi:hypothetical protein